MSGYRLDKSAFKKQTVEEADHQLSYWQQQSYSDRLKAATYLIQSAYGMLDQGFPPFDRASFRHKKKA